MLKEGLGAFKVIGISGVDRGWGKAIKCLYKPVPPLCDLEEAWAAGFTEPWAISLGSLIGSCSHGRDYCNHGQRPQNLSVGMRAGESTPH
jgi:hypothetical protein